MQHLGVEGSPRGASLQVVGSQEHDTYYGFLKEEGDDNSEWLPYVLEAQVIRRPSYAELQNSSVYLNVSGMV